MALYRIITVGKLKEKYWVDAQAEYLKRLQPYLKLELKEVADLPCPEGASAAQEEQVRQGEAAAIVNLILPRSLLVVLDIQGKEMSSPQLAAFLEEQQQTGRELTLVVKRSKTQQSETQVKMRAKDAEALAKFEKDVTGFRQYMLEDRPIRGKFGITHLKNIHKFIFQDVYSFAGKFRLEDIWKGDAFL
jgi:rRNA large subunit m3Psi methyltransferase RlmH